MAETGKIDILEYIKDQSGCEYLSDLCDYRCYGKIKRFLRVCDLNCYPLDQWSYAYNYIFGSEIEFATLDEMHIAFLQKLSGAEGKV